jgi:hypothetical protein
MIEILRTGSHSHSDLVSSVKDSNLNAIVGLQRSGSRAPSDCLTAHLPHAARVLDLVEQHRAALVVLVRGVVQMRLAAPQNDSE